MIKKYPGDTGVFFDMRQERNTKLLEELSGGERTKKSVSYSYVSEYVSEQIFDEERDFEELISFAESFIF